eukprot:6180534-Pleurochrysis_carterae.AAC.3
MSCIRLADFHMFPHLAYAARFADSVALFAHLAHLARHARHANIANSSHFARGDASSRHGRRAAWWAWRRAPV